MPTFCGLQTRQFNDPEAQSYSKFEYVVFGTHNIYYTHTEKKTPSTSQSSGPTPEPWQSGQPTDIRHSWLPNYQAALDGWLAVWIPKSFCYGTHIYDPG